MHENGLITVNGYLEVLHKARDAAGDTMYGKRIDVISGELVYIEKLQDKIK